MTCMILKYLDHSPKNLIHNFKIMKKLSQTHDTYMYPKMSSYTKTNQKKLEYNYQHTDRCNNSTDDVRCYCVSQL